MNEHDKLFKEIQSIKENAIDLIESTFPKHVLAQLNLSSMELDNNSYVDKKLKEYYTDLVYNCKTREGSELKISLLFEHKSYKPENEYLQLLRYLVNIWSYQEKNREPLTLIIPVIFYHGKEKWETRPFSEFFSEYSESIHDFIPGFKYILADINAYDDETIQNELFKKEFNRALALIFKYIHNEELLLDKLFDIFKELKEYIDNEEEEDRIISFIAYIMKLTEITPEKLNDILSRISHRGGDVVMTTAMKLREDGILEGFERGIEEGILKGIEQGIEKGIEQGIEQGIEKGIAEGKAEGEYAQALKTAKMMIKKGYDAELINELTGLSIEEIKNLSQ